ncbi:hypothetical protein WJX72_003397 [[Myrmecia] bisecta]|uniref:Methyltransferase type 11 domain-containing protein n=1 Tax=[Myrmecia] bisecta TaxID=41462 RepID=A0AAW1QPU7_9CHLO
MFSRIIKAVILQSSLTPSGGGAQLEIFDRDLKRIHRDRAARQMRKDDPLQVQVAECLLDRLEDCKRSFHTAVILGGAGECVARRLAAGRAGIKEVIHIDSSAAMLERAAARAEAHKAAGIDWPETHYVQADEEYLPLQEHSADVIISCLGLHWVNDLPGAMTQCRRALKPDGLFLAAMFGGETLQELRIACTLAEQEHEGGVSPRVSPLAQVRDAGNLLTRAGFNIPSVDADDVTVHYRGAQELVEHLRTIGESNAVQQRRLTYRRRTAEAMYATYQSMFGSQDGSVPATYEVIYMTGWSPHESQQQPARRGSQTASFEDLTRALNSGA